VLSKRLRFFSPTKWLIDNSWDFQDWFHIKPWHTLMSIADLVEVWLDAEVFERKRHRVAVGQPR